ADCAAAGPERRRARFATPVKEAVQKIAVLRKELWMEWRIVVAAHEGIGAGRVKLLRDPAERVAVNHNVRIEKDENLAARFASSDVPGAGCAAMSTGIHHTRHERMPARNIRSAVHRSVVADDALKVVIFGSCEAIQRRGEILRSVVRGNNHAETRSLQNVGAV